jgi:hypothetical protein
METKDQLCGSLDLESSETWRSVNYSVRRSKNPNRASRDEPDDKSGLSAMNNLKAGFYSIADESLNAARLPWVQTLVPAFTSCEILGKLQNISVPSFPKEC